MRVIDFISLAKANTEYFQRISEIGIKLHNVGSSAPVQMENCAAQACQGKCSVDDYYSLLKKYLESLEGIKVRIDDISGAITDKIPDANSRNEGLTQ